VRADRHAVCWVLGREAYRSLDDSRDGPGRSARIKLLENLLRASARIVSRLSSEAIAVEG
jgi:hypothetical protein